MNTARPQDAETIALLGGDQHNGVHLTRDQVRHLERIAGVPNRTEAEMALRRAQWAERMAAAQSTWEAMSASERRLKPEPAKCPFPEGLYDHETHAALEEAAHNGLRAMAFLAEFLHKGEDPVRFLENLLIDAGFDCGTSEWVDNETGQQ
jgi:hypothetical protein